MKQQQNQLPRLLEPSKRQWPLSNDLLNRNYIRDNKKLLQPVRLKKFKEINKLTNTNTILHPKPYINNYKNKQNNYLIKNNDIKKETSNSNIKQKDER